MNILDPDVGDILDRMTILHLKLVRAEEPHWKEELDACYKRLEEWCIPVRLLAPILNLMAINAAIWQLTDDLEDGGHEAEMEYGRLAPKLNGRRCFTVGSLNGTLGRGVKREKV